VKHNKLVQFATLFHKLKHGGPMLGYEAHKDLFDFLNLEKNPKMHWTHNFGWAMAQHMHGILGSDKIYCWNNPILVIYLR
jgi:hypothetical protein